MLRFGVTVSAADGSGYAFGFDGAMQDGKADGQVRIEPAAAGADGGADGEFSNFDFCNPNWKPR